MSSPNPITATLIPGDGIGPETVESTIQILDVLGSPFLWDVQQAGVAGIDALGDPLPEQTLASIRKHRLALKGPLTTPVGGGFRSSNVRLREEFELYANVRPAKTLIPGRFENIDIVLVNSTCWYSSSRIRIKIIFTFNVKSQFSTIFDNKLIIISKYNNF